MVTTVVSGSSFLFSYSAAAVTAMAVAVTTLPATTTAAVAAATTAAAKGDPFGQFRRTKSKCCFTLHLCGGVESSAV